jgi:hypothetical protein
MIDLDAKSQLIGSAEGGGAGTPAREKLKMPPHGAPNQYSQPISRDTAAGSPSQWPDSKKFREVVAATRTPPVGAGGKQSVSGSGPSRQDLEVM